MAQSGFLQLNNNDDLSKVIRKCNTNFRALATQKQQQDRINAQAADDTADAIGEALSDIVGLIDSEANTRRGADNDLENAIETVDGKFGDYTKTEDLAAVATSGDYNDLINAPTVAGNYVQKTGDSMSGDLDMMNKNVRAASLNSSMTRNGGNPSFDSESNGYKIVDTLFQDLVKVGARRETDGTILAYLRAFNDVSGVETTEEFRVGLDRNGDAQYYLDTPSALLKALGLVTDVDTSTSYIGVGSAWTLWSAEKRRFGNVITVNLQVSCSSALTAGTTYSVGTVPAAWRPATNVSGTCSEGIGVLTYQGAFSVCPFRNVASATAFRLYFTFIV